MSKSVGSSNSRRFVQFSLRSLLLMMTISGLLAWLYKGVLQRHASQREAGLALAEKGVRIDWEPMQPAWARRALSYFVDEAILNECVAIHGEHCRLKDEDLEPLRRTHYVQRLYLAGNPITDQGLKHLQGLDRLERLSLWGTEITDEGMVYVGKLSALEVLDVHDTGDRREYKLTSRCIKHLSDSSRLRTFLYTFELDDEGVANLAQLSVPQLQNVALRHVSDRGVRHLASWPKLQSVTIAEAKLSERGLQACLRLPNLQHLQLINSEIDRDAWDVLGELTSLKTLSLRGTNIDDDAVARLHDLDQLVKLDLTWTDVTADCLQHCRELAKLEDLDLWEPLDDEAMKWLSEMPSLKTVVSGPAKRFRGRAYLTAEGFRHLAKLNCFQSLNLFDVRYGAGLPGVDVSPDVRIPTGFKFFESLQTEPFGTVGLRGWSDFGKWSSRTSPRGETFIGIYCTQSAEEFFDGVTDIDAESLTMNHSGTMYATVVPKAANRESSGIVSDTKSDERVIRFAFTFPQSSHELTILRFTPHAKHLVVERPWTTMRVNDYWSNLKYVPELDVFEMESDDWTRSRLDATGLRHLAATKSLRRAKIYLDKGVTLDDFALLGKLQHLEELELHCRPLESGHLDVLSEMKALKTLHVSAFPCSVRDESELDRLSKLPRLATLRLDGLTDAGVHELLKIETLAHLTLHGEEISDETRSELKSLRRFRTLEFRD